MNSHSYKFSVLLIALLILLAACDHDDDDEVVPSNQVNTDQTYVDAYVTAGPNGPVTAAVQLLEGGPGSRRQIALTQGDSLWISAEKSISGNFFTDNLFDNFVNVDHTVAKLETPFAGEIEFLFLTFSFIGDLTYSGVINDAGQATYYLTYFREDFPISDRSSVTLPPVFSLTAPLANEAPSRANDIQINWQPAGTVNEVEITANLSCDFASSPTAQYHQTLTTDSGSHTIPGGTLDGGAANECPLTIEVSKNAVGSFDPALNSGQITGHRVDRVTVATTQ